MKTMLKALFSECDVDRQYVNRREKGRGSTSIEVGVDMANNSTIKISTEAD